MNKKLGASGIILAVLGFAGNAFSQANEECRAIPSNVSCVDLSIAISAVDNILDNTNPPTQFPDLGALLNALKTNPGLLAQVNQIFNANGVASFATVDSLFNAVNKCGLIPQVIDEINDGAV